MELLQDIQNDLISPKQDISAILRKCRVLAHRLGNEEFQRWVEQELDGYTRDAELPQYRILDVQSYGYFSGPFGSGLNNAPIPPSCIPKEFRETISKAYLRDPISYYDSLVKEKDSGVFKAPIPADLLVLVGDKIYENMNCMSAYREIPYGAIAALLDTIKNRILSFVLELEDVIPDVDESETTRRPLSQEQVRQVFNTTIMGSVANLSQAGTNVSQSVKINISQGDFDALSRFLESIGIRQEDIGALSDAIERDGTPTQKNSLGENISSWIGEMVSKTLTGAWKVSVSAAPTLLANALWAFFGLK